LSALNTFIFSLFSDFSNLTSSIENASQENEFAGISSAFFYCKFFDEKWIN